MTNTNRKYEVTKTFTSGLLKGLTYTEVTSVNFVVGFSTKEYTITSVVVL
jgi:hypothetical protein